MPFSLTQVGSLVWRDYQTDGVPASGKHSVAKGDIRTWAGEVETYLSEVETTLATHATNISTAQADISTNTTNIATNTSGVAANLATLGTQGAAITAAEADIDALEAFIDGTTPVVAMDIDSLASPLPIGAGGTGSSTQKGARESLQTAGTVEVKTGNYTTVWADRSKLIRFTTSTAPTLTLGAASSFLDGWYLVVKAEGGNITIQTAGAELIDGAATSIIYKGSEAMVFCDGSNYFTFGAPQRLFWTPQLYFGGTEISSSGGTYVSQLGNYSLYGQRMYISSYIELSAKGSATGNATVDLPTGVTLNNNPEFLGIPAFSLSNGINSAPWGLADASLEQVGLRQVSGGGGGSAVLDNTDFNNSSWFYMSGWVTVE